MQRDEFIEAHRAECRRYFQILRTVAKGWRGPRSEGYPNHHDLVAERAARILEAEAPTLQDRIEAGTLVVLGFDR